MAVAGTLAETELQRAMQALLEQELKEDAPGAAVLVAHHGRPLFRAGRGLANLELGVPIAPQMIFRLGSITKQFTAVAILMLVEEGKVALEADLTTYLPDYPTHGQRITVEQLLTHTSGIKSYTGLPEWLPLWRKDMSLDELVALFKDQPLEFVPGERWNYNNSAYLLLGALIERIAGQPYEEFLQQRIFGPLGMQHSAYDRTARVIPGRVSGYQKGPQGYENAPYLSMTHPHAAGALLSSVDDLLLWDEALYGERLVKQDTLRRAFTAARLNDGTTTNYGYGWVISDYRGHRTVEHGGGINGFVTVALRLPDDHLFAAVLMNGTGGEPGPALLAFRLIGLALGEPYEEPAPITLGDALLEGYVGVYGPQGDTEHVVTRDEAGLWVQRTGLPRQAMLALSETEFRLKDIPFVLLRFAVDGMRVGALEIESRVGPLERLPRTDRPLPTAPEAEHDLPAGQAN